MDERTAVSILATLETDKRNAVSSGIIALFHENGLTYRQAVAVLEYMKDRLMDTRI